MSSGSRALGERPEIFNVKDENCVLATRKLKSIKYKWRDRRFERFSRHQHFPSPTSLFPFRAISCIRESFWTCLECCCIMLCIIDPRDRLRRREGADEPGVAAYWSPEATVKTPYGRPIRSGVSRFMVATVYGFFMSFNLYSLFSTLTDEINF